MDAPLKKIKLSVATSDSGGGGVTFSLYKNLSIKDRTTSDYLVGRCSIHAIQLALGNPIKKTFGEGGLLKRNMLQLLHTAYNLQNEFEDQELKRMWKDVTGEDMKKMSAPILTRWWHVGEGARHVSTNWEDWNKLTQAIINTHNTDKACNQIASHLQSMMKEVVLQAHIEFISVYHKLFIDKHMLWLQSTDDRAGEPSFLSCHMLVRVYLIMNDIKMLIMNWKNMSTFDQYFVLC